MAAFSKPKNISDASFFFGHSHQKSPNPRRVWGFAAARESPLAGRANQEVSGQLSAAQQHRNGLALVDLGNHCIELLDTADLGIADGHDDVALANARARGRVGDSV